MADLEKFVDLMLYYCNDADVGYDQWQRWDVYDGGETDCSALVITCLREAGFDVGDATYTGNMSSNLTERGWMRIEPDGDPQYGDILLNDVNHVGVWVGYGVAQASGDEQGGIHGGEAGDQTGYETFVTNGYYDYPWDCYLRWEDDMATAGDVWTYNWVNPEGKPTAPGGNMYNCACNTNTVAHEINNKLDKMQTGNIDYGKLANAVAPLISAQIAKSVADELYNRLKA